MKSDAIVLLQPRADAGLGLIERCRQTAVAASGYSAFRLSAASATLFLR